MNSIAPGKTQWIIPEGFIPEAGPHKDNRGLRSHETACVLNAGEENAYIELTIYFSDRDPAGPYKVVVNAQRTLHLRFDELNDPEPIPRETDYACLIQSSVPVVVQHTRLDTRLGNISLLSTLAFGTD
ncbi:MAG: sensory rhodopsin transducer [Pseudohongiellaceae bacterium]